MRAEINIIEINSRSLSRQQLLIFKTNIGVVNTPKEFKYMKLFFLLLLIILSANFLNAQQSNSYSILLTGNTSKFHNNQLLKKWQKASNQTDSLAFLMLGNIINSGEIRLPEGLFANNKHPLLLAPGEREWANGRSSGKEMIKDLKNKIPGT